MHSISEPASADRWTLVRNARQVLTLRGPDGPRSGAAMAELGIVPNAALLIRNGIIDEVGPARRVENLASARDAREIDATGRIVMPAFVDADVGLVAAEGSGKDSLRLMSRGRVLAKAAATAQQCAGYGCVAVGAHTRAAPDLQSVSRLLRVHRALQCSPLRIQSIFSPQFPREEMKSLADALHVLRSGWQRSVAGREPAPMVEFTAADPDSVPDAETLRAAAASAAALGYVIRLRSQRPPEPVNLQLAIDAGAAAIVAPMDMHPSFAPALTESGSVRVIPASEGFDDASGDAGRNLRGSIDAGAAIALSSSYRLRGISSLNMQYVLHLGVHRLGLSTEEAIMATTWNAACALRLSGVTGSIEPGKPADLLVMDVPDYRELPRRAGHGDVSLAMRQGTIIHRNHSPAYDR